MVQLNEIRSVSVIMPTYNEAGNVADLMIAIVRQIRSIGISDIEIIVVDDDSPDLTWQIAERVDCPDARIRVIRRLANRGLTASLNEGIAAAGKEIIVWLDCDFSQPPERIPQLLFMLTQGFDVAVNSRYVLGGGEARSGQGGELQLFLSKQLNRVLCWLLGAEFHDYTSGFVAARREVFTDLRLVGDYGEYFIDFIYRLLRDSRYRVCELPYIMQPRHSGESKTGANLLQFMQRGRKYLATIIRLRFGGAGK